jgi:AbrB family looped-hinge helix DNA binding protein
MGHTTADRVFATVSSKGQLVIPAEIRESMGIEPGTRVAIRQDGSRLILEPQTLAAKLRLIKELRGCTAGGPSGTDMLLEDRRLEHERELAEGW